MKAFNSNGYLHCGASWCQTGSKYKGAGRKNSLLVVSAVTGTIEEMNVGRLPAVALRRQRLANGGSSDGFDEGLSSN